MRTTSKAASAPRRSTTGRPRRVLPKPGSSHKDALHADIEVPLADVPRMAPDGEGSSIRRAFDLLALISEASPRLRVEQVIERWGYTRSTAYRYLRELCDVGLLAPTPDGGYALGARIVELDRLARLTDPLYVAGASVLPALERDDRVLMLQNLQRDSTLCILKVGPDAIEHAGKRISIRRSRGLPFPLFRGAGSLVLLAWLSAHRIRETYLAHVASIEAVGLGADWPTFRKNILAIRRQGYAVRRGKFGAVAIAVPIVPPGDSRAVGSLVECFASDDFDDAAEAREVAALRDVGARVGAAFEQANRMTATAQGRA